jgi:formylglycine-generating enzyme required for sulfatase activity
MAKVERLAVLGVSAFAASYLLFSYGPGFFKGPQPVDPSGMVWIPAGTFWRGGDNPRMRDAQPAHQVALDGFWMDRTAVTNEQFAQFVEATGGRAAAGSQSPRPRR